MDLAGKYDKTNLLGDGEVQVWRGRERARGTPVLLHTFTGSPRVLRVAVEYLLTRPPASPLLDIGEWENTTCLVTASELDLLDVTAWLESAIRSAPARQAGEQPAAPRVDTAGPVPIPRADSGPVPAPAANPGPGEFTRAFQLPGSNFPPPPSQNPLAGTAPANAPAGPGEFTRMFQLPAKTGSQETAKAPELSMPPPAPLSSAPAAPPPAGEFTRLFKAQPGENAPRDFPVSGSTAPQRIPSPELPAEPVAAKLNIPTGLVPVAKPSAPAVPAGPGEYTRVMQTPSLTTATPQVSTSPSPATAQAVQLPIAVSATPAIPSVPAPPALPTPQAPQVSYAQPSIPVPQAASVQVPVPAPRSGISPVVLFLGGLILVALIFVLVFALRR